MVILIAPKAFSTIQVISVISLVVAINFFARACKILCVPPSSAPPAGILPSSVTGGASTSLNCSSCSTVLPSTSSCTIIVSSIYGPVPSSSPSSSPGSIGVISFTSVDNVPLFASACISSVSAFLSVSTNFARELEIFRWNATDRESNHPAICPLIVRVLLFCWESKFWLVSIAFFNVKACVTSTEIILPSLSGIWIDDGTRPKSASSATTASFCPVSSSSK